MLVFKDITTYKIKLKHNMVTKHCSYGIRKVKSVISWHQKIGLGVEQSKNFIISH